MNLAKLKRLEQLEDELDPSSAWLRTQGLSALLEAAKHLGRCSPEDLEASVYEGAPGFAGLLWQARQRRKDQV